MKKLSIMCAIICLTLAVDAQMSKQEFWRQYRSYHCGMTEPLTLCKERVRKENIIKKRIEDSVTALSEYYQNQFERDYWEAEKARREKMTPEERAYEDQEKRLDFEADKKKFERVVEVSAGGNVADKPGSEPDYKTLPGIVIGVRARVLNLSDEINIGIGAEYSMQGGKYKSYEYIPGGNYGSSSATSRLNYLNFPILAQYQKGPDGFFAEAGLQPGLLLSAKNKGAETTDIKDEVQKFDLGIPIGAGYKFKNKFGVVLRYTHGLLNVNKDDTYKNRNTVISLRGSYAF
ncbi:MAG: porin family protein [Chitinophagaceae bacterium]